MRKRHREGLALAVLLIIGGIVSLAWHPLLAQSGNQWRVEYYANPNWSGTPAYTQYVNLINLNWEGQSPAPGVPATNFTADMTTDAFFYAGVYEFTLLADDELVLWIDNQLYFDTRDRGQSGKSFTVQIPMSQGMHHIVVDYRQYTGPSYLYVNWNYLKPATAPPSVPPPVAPPSATTVITPYGNYTPCIQQHLHQENCFQPNGQWNSPNLGSIQMEPPIVVWGNCKADTIQTMVLYLGQPPQSAKCSKTEAGWYPN